MSILYPVADTVEAALHAPRGYAVRQREAELLAAAAVAFATEPAGPAFATREAALEAYGTAEVPWRQLIPVSGRDGAPRAPLRPTYRDGRRWPEPPGTEEPPLWRLSVSYWRIGGVAGMAPSPLEPARKVRRGEGGRSLGPAALNALARQPLQAARAQRPLDIGLFEVHPPEAPDLLIPDE